MVERGTSSAHQHKPPPLDLSSLALPPLPTTSTATSTTSNNSPLSARQYASQSPTSSSYTSSTRPRPSFHATGGVPPTGTSLPITSTSSYSAGSHVTQYAHATNGFGSAGLRDATGPTSAPPPAISSSPLDPRPLPRLPPQPPATSTTMTTTTSSPTSSQSLKAPTPSSSNRRLNPLEDLIETETLYVQDLSVIIKRVAAAWSRTNFPPPALDSMFRAIEAVYRANKSLLTKLDEIGPNPTSPKALGDLLMRLIPDVSPAYTRYSATLETNFDQFEPVQSNPNLHVVLNDLDWPKTITRPSNSISSKVTLDLLFDLPRTRLQYYKKLYTKLLKSTQPGRSDHKILVDANLEIDRLLKSCEQGQTRTVSSEVASDNLVKGLNGDNVNGSTTLPLFASKRTRDAGTTSPVEAITTTSTRPDGFTHAHGVSSQSSADTIKKSTSNQREAVVVHPPQSPLDERNSGESARGDSSASSLRSSSATGASTANTSAMTHSVVKGSMVPFRIEELERRLSTDGVLDIFTMTPKKCKLQIAPPGLNFIRQIRKSTDVSISFVPSSDTQRQQVVYRHAHIILLTDLFLVCQHMSNEERQRQQQQQTNHSFGEDGPDMWLMFPPLAGKHLKVDIGTNKNEFEVTIMRKEKLIVKTLDAFEASEWRTAFEQAIAFGIHNGHAATRADSTASRSTTTPSSANQSSFGGREALRVDVNVPSTQIGLLRGQRSASSPNHDSPIDSQQQQRLESPSRPDFRLSPEPPIGYGAAPISRQQPYGDPRRAISGGVTSPTSFVSGPSPIRGPVSSSSGASTLAFPMSPAYPPSDYSQRSSPSPYDRQDKAFTSTTTRTSLNDRAGSPYGQQSTVTDNMSGRPPRGPSPFDRTRTNILQHSDSIKSSSSFASEWTEQSFPEPPPLPGKAYGRFQANSLGYNNGHHGQLIGTSRSTNDLLSPGNSIYRSKSAEGLRRDYQQQQQQHQQQHQQQSRQYRMPSSRIEEARSNSAPGSAYGRMGGDQTSTNQEYDDSPPTSPIKSNHVLEKTSITAQMRCKMFLQQNHGQWKNLGLGKLKLFLTSPSMMKQLVVDHDKSNKTVISTIVITDAVERVGKTGVAVELSDKGDRTGIIYMLQMKTEQAATGLFEQLLVGSDRDTKRMTR
ncbi:hypothetical protein OIO90_005900 [Microbotryomycetes sp. JL221]|nr:hypothetical protein OIO90_005900 [Microbotryomycetes sp. JL221]